MSGSSPARRRLLVPLLRLLVAGAALLALARLVQPAEIARAMTLVRQVGWPLALVLLPTLVAIGLDSQGWRQILATLGHTVAWRRMLELRLSVEALVLALPGGSVAGEAVKLALLRRRAGVPLTAGAASLALTKGLLIGAEAGYLALAAAWLGLGPAGARAGGIPAKLALGGAAVTAAISLAIFAVLRDASWASRLGGWLRAVPSARLRRWAEGRQAAFRELDEAARGFFAAPRARRAACIVPFFLEWLVEGLETLIILRCLGVPLQVGAVLALDAVGSLLRACAFFVPAGLGVQDAAHIFMLKALGVADPVVTGAALIFIKRTKEVFWVVTGASFLAARKDLWRQTTADRAA